MDLSDKKEKIVDFLKREGPSLPASISRFIGMDLFLTSAILSEMLGEKRIKASFMKIGSSPLYFLPDQEKELERFVDKLGGVEREAVELLKKGVLKDSEQEPKIRVALRSLKDFAEAFKKDGEIFWRYRLSDNSEQADADNENKEDEKPEEEAGVEENSEKADDLKETTRDVKEETQKQKGKKPDEESKKMADIFENKSGFFEEVDAFLKKRGIVLKEKIQSDRKEVVGVVEVESKVGRINFLLIAKNKKSLSKDEVNSSIQRAVYQKMPCLLLIRKEPPKTLKKFVENNNLIKVMIFGNNNAFKEQGS